MVSAGAFGGCDEVLRGELCCVAGAGVEMEQVEMEQKVGEGVRTGGSSITGNDSEQ